MKGLESQMKSLHDEILQVVTECMERQEMKTIEIKYLTDIKPIEVNPKGDWIDLRSAEEIETRAGEFYLVHLGIACKLPTGYEAHIAPRSSSYKKWGFLQVNSVGVIDETYCGDNDEWCIPIIALRNGKIHKNDRICQFRIMKKMPALNFIVKEELGNEDRGGFGSTGKD